MSYFKISLLLLLSSLAFTGVILPAGSQRARAASARLPMHRQEPTAQVNDVTISKFKRFEGMLDGTHVVSGSDVTVDTTDPKEPRSRNRLQARTFTLVQVKDNPRLAERIEAEGNFRFSGTRPTADGKAIRTFKGTGSKGIYFKQEGRILFEGPVAFTAQQPTLDGKGIQTVEGTASSATYIEKTGILTAKDIKASITDPGTEGANHIRGDTLKIDLSKRPYTYLIENDDESHGSVHYRPKQPEKKPEKKPG
jgi:lipopolysaccharide export system protein LptA